MTWGFRPIRASCFHPGRGSKRISDWSNLDLRTDGETSLKRSVPQISHSAIPGNRDHQRNGRHKNRLLSQVCQAFSVTYLALSKIQTYGRRSNGVLTGRRSQRTPPGPRLGALMLFAFVVQSLAEPLEISYGSFFQGDVFVSE